MSAIIYVDNVDKICLEFLIRDFIKNRTTVFYYKAN